LSKYSLAELLTPLQVEAANRWSKERTGPVAQMIFTRAWGQLECYNGERARGLVHTADWVERMAALQELYHEWVRNEYKLL
jgi:hypothetical protein